MEQTDHVMHAVTQVRTPDELQNIYKELLKLKTMMSQAQSAASSLALSKSSSIVSATSNGTSTTDRGSVVGSESSSKKRVTFPAVLAHTMNEPAAKAGGTTS